MKNLLYVLHSGTAGGTFLTNNDLMKNVEGHYEIFLLGAENDSLRLYKYSNGKLSLIKKYIRKNKWSAKNFHDSWLTYIYFDILINYKIDLIHIRHFINHSFDLPLIAKKLNIPVIVSIHDFYLICPFYVLLNENNEYCAGKCNNNSINCYNSLASLNDINSKQLIDTWRFEVSLMMNHVNCFITTSNIVKELFLSIYPELIKSNFQVIEHGRDFPKANSQFYEIPSSEDKIKILCPANYLNAMKGSEFIKTLKNIDKDNKLEFHFLGNCRDGIEEYGINHGTFERDEFFKKLKNIKPSFIGIFSIWPETYCHTLTEAWSCGVPVLGSNIGVIEDRILAENGGWVVDINNPDDAYDLILKIASDTHCYLDMVNNVSEIYLKSTKEMSNQYLEIYNYLVK